MKTKSNLLNQVFGKLTVIGIGTSRIRNDAKSGKIYLRPYWLCKCSCENQSLIEVKETRLKSGIVRSCGCLRSDSAKNRKTIRERNIDGTYK